MSEQRILVATTKKNKAYEEAARLNIQQPKPREWCYFWDYMPSNKNTRPYTETMVVGIYKIAQPKNEPKPKLSFQITKDWYWAQIGEDPEVFPMIQSNNGWWFVDDDGQWGTMNEDEKSRTTILEPIQSPQGVRKNG